MVGVPARIAGPKKPEGPGTDPEHGKLPDPVLKAISEALDRQSKLEERVPDLELSLASGEENASLTQLAFGVTIKMDLRFNTWVPTSPLHASPKRSRAFQVGFFG